jgi:hypothetical protein
MKKNRTDNKLAKTASASILITLCVILTFSCNPAEKKAPASENNIDAARNFIRAALDGKFNEARNFMLADSLNNNYLDVVGRSYENLDPSIKDSYKGSTIIIKNTNELNDSVSVIVYANSYKNDFDTLKVVRKDGQWLVDLKYLYLHDTENQAKK